MQGTEWIIKPQQLQSREGWLVALHRKYLPQVCSLCRNRNSLFWLTSDPNQKLFCLFKETEKKPLLPIPTAEQNAEASGPSIQRSHTESSRTAEQRKKPGPRNEDPAAERPCENSAGGKQSLLSNTIDKACVFRGSSESRGEQPRLRQEPPQQRCRAGQPSSMCRRRLQSPQATSGKHVLTTVSSAGPGIDQHEDSDLRSSLAPQQRGLENETKTSLHPIYSMQHLHFMISFSLILNIVLNQWPVSGSSTSMFVFFRV